MVFSPEQVKLQQVSLQLVTSHGCIAGAFGFKVGLQVSTLSACEVFKLVLHVELSLGCK